MSSETITRNDIVAILNKTIPGQGTDMSSQGVEDFIDDLNLGPSDYVKLSELGDYVVEQGTSGIWTYRKWNSGIAECWGKTSIQPVCSRAFGNIYITQTSNPGVNYPFTFITITTENISTIGASGNCWIMAESTNYTALSQAPAYWVCRPTQATAAMNVNISYYTMGTWK